MSALCQKRTQLHAYSTRNLPKPGLVFQPPSPTSGISASVPNMMSSLVTLVSDSAMEGGKYNENAHALRAGTIKNESSHHRRRGIKNPEIACGYWRGR